MTYLALNVNFELQFVSAAPVDADILVKTENLEFLGVTQLVQIAKSMNPDLKVNNKQKREIIIDAIQAELVNVPVKQVESKVVVNAKPSTKSICWAQFELIDMNDKPTVRAAIEQLVLDYDFPKRVVQSYASDFRKFKKETTNA